MDRDDIIRMAREAKAGMLHGGEYSLMGNAAIERFAALVAAAEREACAKVCDEIYFANYPDAEEWERSEESEAIRARGQE